jgi:hypothetical protein
VLFFNVSFFVALNLCLPKFHVGFGKSVILAFFMPMPETTVYKDDRSVFP